MWRARISRLCLAGALCLGLTGCLDDSKPGPCGPENPCTQPERPYCDVVGDYGEAGECIAAPIGPGQTDAGPDAQVGP